VKNLILVHGINNQDLSKDEIEERWIEAIKMGVGRSTSISWSDVSVKTAYYADVLHEAEQDWITFNSALKPMSVNSPDSDFVSKEIATLYIELQKTLGISDDEVRQYLEEGELNVSFVRMGRGIHKRWLKAVAKALEKKAPGAIPGLVRAFLGQAAAYLYKPQLFEHVNSLVEEQIFRPDQDLKNTVIVAHSLGTVISYVLLRKMFRKKPLPLFLTVGSPLGIKVVKDRIGMPFVTPEVVRNWVNGSDPADFVALHPELTKETFGPAKLENLADLDNGTENPHDVTRYLAQPGLGKILEEALTSKK
jgi:hypothetical protein